MRYLRVRSLPLNLFWRTTRAWCMEGLRAGALLLSFCATVTSGRRVGFQPDLFAQDIQLFLVRISRQRPTGSSAPRNTGPKRARLSRFTRTPWDSHRRRTSRLRPSIKPDVIPAVDTFAALTTSVNLAGPSSQHDTSLQPLDHVLVDFAHDPHRIFAVHLPGRMHQPVAASSPSVVNNSRPEVLISRRPTLTQRPASDAATARTRSAVLPDRHVCRLHLRAYCRSGRGGPLRCSGHA